MKLDSVDKQFVTNASNTQKFTIEASSKMFEILYDKIYTNKIAAIVRELSANAYDSHIQAGKADVPFHVQLPSQLDPTFMVEDFGVGLSHEEVTNLLTVYGGSSKTGTNELIGGFGLGAKTPFAYGKAFTVRSRYNGVERLYTCYLDEERNPALSVMNEKPTTECNGVAFKIHIDGPDIRSFKMEAEQALSFYPVAPIVSGEADFTPRLTHDQLMQLRQEGLMFGGSERHRSGRVYVVMGVVAYPVPDLTPRVITYQSWYQSDADIYLWAEVGEYPIAVSRESITLDSHGEVAIAIEERVRTLLNKKSDEWIQRAISTGNWIEAFKLLGAQFSISPYDAYRLNLNKSTPAAKKLQAMVLEGSQRREALFYWLGITGYVRASSWRVTPSKISAAAIIDSIIRNTLQGNKIAIVHSERMYSKLEAAKKLVVKGTYPLGLLIDRKGRLSTVRKLIKLLGIESSFEFKEAVTIVAPKAKKVAVRSKPTPRGGWMRLDTEGEWTGDICRSANLVNQLNDKAQKFVIVESVSAMDTWDVKQVWRIACLKLGSPVCFVAPNSKLALKMIQATGQVIEASDLFGNYTDPEIIEAITYAYAYSEADNWNFARALDPSLPEVKFSMSNDLIRIIERRAGINLDDVLTKAKKIATEINKQYEAAKIEFPLIGMIRPGKEFEAATALAEYVAAVREYRAACEPSLMAA